ncbi:MAG: hypothetical protein H6721_13425 [Sandaracinus sp.]|nr:hypothetical protein [Sandaracinus sp.]MCB9633115.1 hypothetical protein [Sandaracinus sp.]
MPRIASVVLVLAASAGLASSSVSTLDFVQHLDRQVHGLHCSFLPGLDEAHLGEASGCQVALMSPYSSVLRESIWGGLPVSLPAMGVFAFLLWATAHVWLCGLADRRRTWLWLAAAWSLPFLTSIVMGSLALTQLDAFCKLCVLVYAASTIGFGTTLFVAWRLGDREPVPRRPLVVAVVVGLACVVVPASAYALVAPDFDRYVGACGQLADASDRHRILLDLGGEGPDVIEVLDPLCPSCRSFEKRFAALGGESRAKRRALLFPLDDACNWMVAEALHPGACAVSEAVLCAEERAPEVLAWAFEEQERIVEATRADPGAAARLVSARFPEVASCVGTPAVRNRLNHSLRWAVKNQLPVMTPQAYVDGTRVCDADTDLGLDYVLARLLEREGGAR